MRSGAKQNKEIGARIKLKNQTKKTKVLFLVAIKKCFQGIFVINEAFEICPRSEDHNYESDLSRDVFGVSLVSEAVG